MRFLLPLILLGSLTSAAAGGCRAIDGIEPLLRPGRILLLGELHGTEESPAFALDVACHSTAAGLPVVFAMELLENQRDRIERFLASGGTPDDRTALMAGPTWQREYQDGRNSHAMLGLIDGLRRLREAGASIRVVLFDARVRDRDRAMGQQLADAVGAEDTAMTIVLTGNMHSRVTRGSRRSPDFEPMGFVLRQQVGGDRLVSLNVGYAGGSAWLCTPNCGVVEFGSRPVDRLWQIEIDEETRPAGHDGWYHVGVLRASLPARDPEGARSVQPVEQPPAPAPAPPTPPIEPADSGPLSDAEKRYQGRWQAYDYGSPNKTWGMQFDGRRFRAEGGSDDWYEGRIVIDPDREPKHWDFVIDDCRCAYKGQASRGIFRWEKDRLVIAAPRPGGRRARLFNPRSGEMMELRRVTGVEAMRTGD